MKKKWPDYVGIITKMLIGNVYSGFPFKGISNPIFIIGCGRSGTTILGTALSKHKKVTYLNEPRLLWRSCYPETDIWSKKAAARNAKLVLTASDAKIRKSKKLSRLFRFETIITRKPVLIEKLPINNFRLQFISTIFPDARFIHIYRNGLEVARSIEMSNGWYSKNPYRWNQLVQFASLSGDTSVLPELCTSDKYKGLLEWRLSTETAVNFLKTLSKESFYEISYDSL
ncbi:MAG: hypothetical protein CV087_23140, partial [Candidatus Brocadia sp. WS118]